MGRDQSRQDPVGAWASGAAKEGFHPDSVRTIYPATWPQYPYDDPPPTPEQSQPSYGIRTRTDLYVAVRDGTKLAIDTFLPATRAGRFPALVSFSPYTRPLQQTVVPLGQNEAGITEFWVPRGYAHVVVDVRGSGDSEGTWDHWGPTEQQDMFDIISWVVEQPWCDGNIGMMGCSYFGMTQLQVAALHPPGLKATFAYDAETDLYRGFYFNGGIPQIVTHWWMSGVPHFSLPGGRTQDPSGFFRHGRAVLGMEEALDGPYWHERSSWPTLGEIDIPVYFGCDWQFYETHLHGLFQGWEETGDIPKRALVGPRATPFRPWANQHMEALRWYDHWLKGMDTGVMDGPPIRLWIQGEDHWRAENEWPLARTEWTDFYLSGPPRGTEGTLIRGEQGPAGSRSFDFDPHQPAALHGRPALIYRSAPLDRPLEITGPAALHLSAASSKTTTDWYARLYDEDESGNLRQLCKGWLRATHRALDKARTTPWRPYHPHTREEPLTPGEAYEFAIELWPTSNVFHKGHRIRLEISSSEVSALMLLGPTLMAPEATNTVLEGGPSPSRLLLPVIPRE